ncbi:MAG TPA: IS4 family transposase [Gemmata sp.]|nr:IS4 family transposase [Gemmata sp.]
MSSPYDSRPGLGREVFGTAELGDRRRTERLVHTFDRMCAHPGGTLPDKLASPPDLRGLYRLCDADEVTHEAVLAPARAHTRARVENCPGDVLVLHDATELDYTTLSSLAGDLGQIGKGDHRGFLCHNVLAVEADSGEVLGLMDQLLHRRDEVPDGETLTEHRDRATRESRLWVLGTRYLPADARLIDIADQGADTFEFLEHESHSGRRFVIRATKPRKVYAGHQPTGPRQELKAYARSLPELGRFTMDVQAQPGRKPRTAAEFVVRGAAVLVCPPHAKAGHHGDDPLPLYVVQVTEVSPPEGEKAIEWTLLTNERVQTFKDTWRVTGWYERRWVVEEYHKAQKTGCRIEGMQFTTTDRLEPAIALLSVVAVTLLNLREASRRADAGARRADTLLSCEYVEVLSLKRYGKVRDDLTVREFFLALARFGGHQNRKCDGPPGWLVLWRGWMKLQAMLDGYLAARLRKCGKT